MQDKQVEKEKKSWDRRNQKIRSLRSFRSNMRDVQKRKQRETLKRASMPRTKQSRQKKKKRNAEKTVSAIPVNDTHESRLLEISGDEELLKIYTQNYNNWQCSFSAKMKQAEEIDLERDSELKKKQETENRDREFSGHRENFTPCLEELASVLPHHRKTGFTWGTNRTFRASGSIMDYLIPERNSTTKFVKRFYHKLYYDSIHMRTSVIAYLPELDVVTRKVLNKEYQGAKTRNKINRCSDCNTNMFTDHVQGCMVCPVCGATRQGGEGVGVKASYSHMQSTVRPPAPYER